MRWHRAERQGRSGRYGLGLQSLPRVRGFRLPGRAGQLRAQAQAMLLPLGGLDRPVCKMGGQYRDTEVTSALDQLVPAELPLGARRRSNPHPTVALAPLTLS